MPGSKQDRRTKEPSGEKPLVAEADGDAYEPRHPVAEPLGHRTGMGTGELRPICVGRRQVSDTVDGKCSMTPSSMTEVMGRRWSAIQEASSVLVERLVSDEALIANLDESAMESRPSPADHERKSQTQCQGWLCDLDCEHGFLNAWIQFAGGGAAAIA